MNNNGENNPNLQYSTDCENWQNYSSKISISANEKLFLKGNNHDGWAKSSSIYSTLEFSGNVSLSGNIMGLLDNGAKPGDSGDITAIPDDYCFYRLFGYTHGITSVSSKFLPATTLAKNCYGDMFWNCETLTTAPELPATELADNCYAWMFGKTSLTEAHNLPATTLANGCYQGMFYECSLLSKIQLSYTGSFDYEHFKDWVRSVASSGTFYYNGSDRTTGTSAIPSGWTVQPF